MEIIEFEEIFSPVVRFLSIVILVAMLVDDNQKLYLMNGNAMLFLKRRSGKALHDGPHASAPHFG